MNLTVALMLKAPVPGRVKTRLAASMGSDAACAVYRRLVEHQMAQIPVDWRVEVHFDPPDTGELMRDWLGSRAVYFPQCEGNLGERLIGAMLGSTQSNPVPPLADRRQGSETDPLWRYPLIFIGGDCPYLDTKTMERAMEALAMNDLVLGPAMDGGYVLIGMNNPHAGLFEGIAWSTDRVFFQTLERARDADLTVVMLPEMEDVDDLTSWERAEDYLNRRQPS